MAYAWRSSAECDSRSTTLHSRSSSGGHLMSPGDVAVHARQVYTAGARQERAKQLGAADHHDFRGTGRAARSAASASCTTVTPSRR